MVTKKLKNFEYAGLKTAPEYASKGNFSEVNAFETPNGNLLVSVVGIQQVGQNPSISSIICERIKYYLDNEVLENAADALFNALAYTNGFVLELKRKQELHDDVRASVACILIKNSIAYYGWMGESSFYLFNGKRVYPLGGALLKKEVKETENLDSDERVLYLGDEQFAEPAVCEQPVVPVDGDIILAGAGKTWETIKPKIYNGILADSMPTLTKAQRLLGIAGDTSPENSAAIQLVSFYNLENEQTPVTPVTKEPEQDISSETSYSNESANKLKNKRPLKRTLIIVACLLAVAYMFYDLFLKDPVNVVNVSATETEIEADGGKAGEGSELAALPADVSYTVQSGDTWARIYTEFEVCSWFIKNHPPNSGRFDRDENPVAGRSILIPVKYSAKKELNPKFFSEFSLDKLGRTCQNANAEYRDAFEKKVN